MTNIKATCPECGEVELTSDDIQLRISSEEYGSSYCFECPMCVSEVSKPADSRIIQLLISGGVKAKVEGMVSASPAPAFTYDDLLDFHLELQREDALEEFLRTA